LSGDIHTFGSARQLAAYDGLTPQEHTSGTSVNGKTRLCKMGNARMRKALYFPAIAFLRCAPELQPWQKRLKAAGKIKMAIIGAAMHKLIRIVYGVLASGQKYDPAKLPPLKWQWRPLDGLRPTQYLQSPHSRLPTPHSMRHPTLRLILTLALGWIAFLSLGLGLRQGLARPTVTVIIDRSYCAPAQWQPIAVNYAALYEQHRQGKVQINQVIYVSDLGPVVADAIPTPEDVSRLSTFGRFNPTQMDQARQAQPDAEVFSCNVSQ